MLIHLIRHTTPDIEKGICYGQADVPLKGSFKQEQLAQKQKLLPEYDAVYTSSLSRCSRLAKTIEGKQHITDQRLLEYNFGDWELKHWNNIKHADSQTWMDDFVNQPAPNGESIVIMKTRVDHFFDELLEQPFKSVAVVTHSGVQRLIHARILHTPLTLLFRLQLDFGAVLEWQHQKQSKLSTIRHL